MRKLQHHVLVLGTNLFISVKWVIEFLDKSGKKKNLFPSYTDGCIIATKDLSLEFSAKES